MATSRPPPSPISATAPRRCHQCSDPSPGVATGLVTTSDGFRDLLEDRRQKRPDLYDLTADKPPTLVPRALRMAVGRPGAP